jgi:hypothetical protein
MLLKRCLRSAGCGFLVAVLAACANLNGGIDDPLPSWRAGAAKQAITDFVGRVTDPGHLDFVAPAARALKRWPRNIRTGGRRSPFRPCWKTIVSY